MAVRVLPPPDDGLGRVETGAIQFGDDWPGLFVRGDVALHLASCIQAVLDAVPDDATDAKLFGHALEGVARLIHKDVLVRPPGKAQNDEGAVNARPPKARTRRSGATSRPAGARPRKRP